MASWTSQRTGTWSVTSDNAASPWHDGGAQTALAAIPANTDTVTIANTHDVEFDVDQSGFAAGITLTIAAGGTLHASTTAGSYYLKCQANLTLNGTLQAGTSVAVPYPSTCTFTIYLNGAFTINMGSAANLYLYCVEPTNKYVTISTPGEAIGQTILSVDQDVTADSWADGNYVVICDVAKTGVPETQTTYIAAGGIAAGSITVNDALVAAKNTGAYIVLRSRNIKITGSTTYAVTPNGSTGNYIAAEIYGCTYGITFVSSSTIAGVVSVTNYGANGAYGYNNSTYSGVIVGGTRGVNSIRNATHSGLIVGCSEAAVNGGNFVTNTGLLVGSANGIYGGTQHVHTGTISGCNYGVQSCYPFICYGTIENCAYGLGYGVDQLFGNATFSDNTNDLYRVLSARFHNTAFGTGTEFSDYNNTGYRAPGNYIESLDHDQVANSFKAWCLGGIVTSQTASPPTGYTIWYEHACESATYPCFRQYQTTVLPGTAIEVVGKIRIADGEDLSSNPPALQIIDVFGDPLVDDTQTPLDECEIPEPDGGVESDWQDVSVIWANQGDSPRQVLVRMIAYHATADVDEVWSVATYQDQIATLYNTLIPVKTTVATADTTTSFTLAGGEATADAYNNMTLMVQDADDDHWELRAITDWTAGLVVTVDTAFSFTPAVGDLAYIMATSYGASTSAVADAVWDEALTGASHNVPTSAGRRLRTLGDVVSSAVNDVAATTTEFDTDLTAQDGQYNDQVVLFTTGNLAGQVKPIRTYTQSGGHMVMDEAFTEAPANNDEFDILPTHVHPISQIADGIWDEAMAGHTDAGKAGAQLWTDIDAIVATLSDIEGIEAGKKVISTDGLTVQIYDKADALLVTLVRSGTGPYTWTPTWE